MRGTVWNAGAKELADMLRDLADAINKCAPCPELEEHPYKLRDFGRAMAIARTNLQTAELWLREAAEIEP